MPPHLRTYPSQPSLRCLNVIGWFRSTSPDTEVVSTLPLRYNDSFDMCPIIFYKTFPSHISVTDFTVSIFLNIIGLFRSTVLRVMSPTRSKAQQACVLCATMILIRPIRFLSFSIAYRLVANSLFFCALEAVIRTLVQFDSINYALTIELMHR